MAQMPLQEIWDMHRFPEQDMYPFAEFLRHKAAGTILEIGVRGGSSTSAFLLGLEQQGGHLYSVDIDATCGDLLTHPQWTFIDSNSGDVASVMSHVPSGSLDILFIDGDHTHPVVDNDLYGYAPFVRDGGLILMHDIVPDYEYVFEDVRDVYHKFLTETGYIHFELPGMFGMGVIYKGKPK